MVWLVEAAKDLRCGMVCTQHTSYERCRLELPQTYRTGSLLDPEVRIELHTSEYESWYGLLKLPRDRDVEWSTHSSQAMSAAGLSCRRRIVHLPRDGYGLALIITE